MAVNLIDRELSPVSTSHFLGRLFVSLQAEAFFEFESKTALA